MLARTPASQQRFCQVSGRTLAHHGARVHRRAVVQAQASADTASSSSPSTPPSKLNGYKVIVAGATGGCGREVVKALEGQGAKVRALVRDPSKARSLESSSVEVVMGDVYQYATLPKALDGMNALVIATGPVERQDPLGPYKVDYQGNLNLFAAAKRAGIEHVVLITSIGADDILNPLNLFWGVLFWKKRAEEELQRSGLKYTVVRPGGLKSKLREGEAKGNIVMAEPDTYGFPPLKASGSLLRSQVAEVCVGALREPAAANKVVEVIAQPEAPVRSVAELFESIVL